MKQGETTNTLILAAAGEVDRALLLWSLSLGVRERLRAATRAARTLQRLNRGASQDR